VIDATSQDGEAAREDSGQALELSAPDYVVLGMIRLGARSGYEVKQRVGQSIRFFWTISQVQIYPSLGRLERAGLITGADDPRGRRRRRAYEITRAGEAALRQWLRRTEPMPFELRDVGLVRLFFADALTPGEASELLGAVKRRSQERLTAFRAIGPSAGASGEESDVYPLLTLHLGIGVHQAIVDVCQDFEHRLGETYGPAPGD
jgi:PadR family transcriptional regulator AphA